ncbi:MAG: multiple sugar transport system substrate-binding protein [Frankiales bacterium]|nr:multiple sugar transport system substrate-binding protein [Frankiales bacterium]
MRKTSSSRLSLAAVLACGLTVTACGGGSSSAGAGSTTTAAGGAGSTSAAASASGGAATSAPNSGPVVKLSMLTGFTGPDKPSYDALIKSFNATHPNIQVTMDVEPWDAIGQKLPQEWATGQGPDLATPSSDPDSIFQYIKTNSVVPLTSAVGTGDTQIQSAAFPASVTQAFTVNGQLYAVPANLATLVLYYNKDMFSKANIAAAPTTQADFVADAKALTLPTGAGKPTQYGLTLADHATIQMWPILQWMNGGDIIDAKGCSVLSQPKSVDALTLWSDLVTKNHISPVGQTGADADTLFSAKKAAMEINGPWAAAGFRSAGINLGIAPVPVGAAGPVTLGSTVPLMVAKSGKHVAQAEEFLAWWTGKTAQTQFSKISGFPPVRTDLGSTVTGDATTFAAALPSSRLYLAGIATGAKIDSDVYVPLIGEITRGADVAKSAKSADSQVNSITGCKS